MDAKSRAEWLWEALPGKKPDFWTPLKTKDGRYSINGVKEKTGKVSNIFSKLEKYQC